MNDQLPSEGARAGERRQRPSTLLSLGAAVALLCIGTAATVSVRSPELRRASPSAELVIAPAPVPEPPSPLRLDGALVRGAARNWAAGRTRPVRRGEPVPVQLTAYCLQGTTRRDNLVREGIVAADPRLFPLGGYVEVYVGRKYHGRFLVDDTGGVIKEGILDIWTPSCRDARRFGRRRGTAVLVARPRGASEDTLLTGRLRGPSTR
ncbi:MAG TPA: 3D domain-containing protein [Gemmatimonadaceae bacterium]|nr:3D domain-containing protein [Gemmatimonadaceae bacterium]